jgi:hypothetical protein
VYTPNACQGCQGLFLKCTRDAELDDLIRTERCNQLTRCAKRDHATVVHNRQPVAEARSLFHVVRCQDDRSADLPELFDHFPEFQPCLRIKSRCRFVKKQEVGIAYQGTGNRQALPLASRELTDARIALFIELDKTDHGINLAPVLVETPEESHSFRDREFLGQLSFLKLDADVLAQVIVIAGAPGASEHFDCASCWRSQTFENLNGCCLAGAVGPKQSEALPGSNFKIKTIDSSNIAVTFDQFETTRRRCIN